jgi:hypothetical protein
MFSNAKKFVKKNILLIGIVLFVILIAVYLLYVNVKEGFDGSTPVNVNMIPISTIKKMYVELGNTPSVKVLLDPIIEMMTLIIANYAEANKVSILIENVQTDVSKVWTQPLETGGSQSTQFAAVDVIQKKADSIIKPIVMKLLPVVYKIFALQKTIINNVQSQIGPVGDVHTAPMLASLVNKWVGALINVTFADKTLATILGPDYSIPMPALPIYNGYTGNPSNSAADKVQPLVDATRSALDDYYNKILLPFIIVNMYASQHESCQELVVKLTDNFTNSLTNYMPGQASITNLQGSTSMVSTNFTPTWMTTKPTTDTTKPTTNTTKPTTPAWSPWTSKPTTNTTKPTTNTTKPTTPAWSPWTSNAGTKKV